MGPFELLLAMNVLLSSRVLGDVRCPPAKCQYEDSNTKCHLSLDTVTACSCPTCAVDSTLFGSFKPDSLKVALNYTARRQADMIVTWDYLHTPVERIPSGETAFEISHHSSDGKRGTVCFCLPNTVTMVTAPLSHLSDSRIDQVTVTLKFEVATLGIDALRHLSTNVSVDSSEKTVCEKDTTSVCPPTYKYEDGDTSCRLTSDIFTTCPCPTCAVDSTLFGSFKPDSLKVALNYTARRQADVIVTWDYLSERTPSGETAFEISHHTSDGKRGTVCFCLPNTVTMVIAPLSHLPDYGSDSHIDQVKVTLRIEVERPEIDSLRHLSSDVTVRDCFETVGSSENTVCGKDMPHAPVNAKATVIGQSPGKTVVKVTWEHAEGGVKADWYDLDFISDPREAHVNVPGNTTKQTVTINQSLMPSSGAYFMIRSGGYSYEKDRHCHCQTRLLPQPVLFCHGTNATLLFPGPPLNVHFIFWPVLAGVVIVAIVIALVVCGVWRCSKCKNDRSAIYDPVPITDDVEMEVREQGPVFLVASTEEDELVKRRIRHLCHVLADNKLTPVYYEYVANDHSEGSPSAMGMNRWVERQFSRCEFVLFVCTKRFLEEWNGERRDILSPLVYPCRHLLDGSLTRPQNISRFAVLFMGDGHNVPPVMGRFRQFDVFQAGSDDIDTDSLIRYLLEVPRFAPPRIVNFFRQFV